jgi:hypothetical protein
MPTEKTLKHQGTAETVADMKAITNKDATGTFNYYHPIESDEAHRWRCMKRNMRHDERVDREAGLRLLENAGKLPVGDDTASANRRYDDMAELRKEFEERFGKRPDEEDKPKGTFRR